MDGCLDEDRVAALIGGALSADARAAADEHLDACAMCFHVVARASQEAALSLPPRGEFGRYKLERLIGRGGMGVVFAAHDERLGRPIAIKLLHDAIVGSSAARRRFIREARLAAAVRNPHIAAVYDIDEHDGRFFIAMELVDGQSLRQRLLRGSLSPDEAIVVARAIARGLASAHDRGIVHRDLKPDNVMLVDGGGVKLLDFGLAIPFADARDDRGAPIGSAVGSAIGGTRGYAAPEQARGEAVDHRADLYSFGVVLHEMVTGARPTAGTPPRTKTGLAALDGLIAHCIAERDVRIDNAVAIIAALDRISTSTWRHSRARTALAGAAIVAAVAAVAIVASSKHGKHASLTVAPANLGADRCEHVGEWRCAPNDHRFEQQCDPGGHWRATRCQPTENGPTSACTDAHGYCVDTAEPQWSFHNRPADRFVVENAADKAEEIVRDRWTGLSWQLRHPDVTYAWGRAAESYCEGLDYGGHHDWRLPSPVELLSLLDVAQPPSAQPVSGRPAVAAPFGAHTKAAVYWTSAPVAGTPSMAWSVDFWNGPINDYPVGYTFLVRCVR